MISYLLCALCVRAFYVVLYKIEFVDAIVDLLCITFYLFVMSALPRLHTQLHHQGCVGSLPCSAGGGHLVADGNSGGGGTTGIAVL